MATDKLYPEGLLGKKIGMTQIFSADGESIPVTVLQAGPCYVLEVKEHGKHGYSAVQCGFERKKQQRVTKPQRGHFAKAERGAFYFVRELRCDCESLGWDAVGKELQADEVFEEGQFVDVTGVSKGRGFTGVVRRYNMAGQPATRGTHEVRRNVGSVGCCKSPGRIFKNKRMPGHMGNERVTVQNLKVMGVLPEKNLILVKGAVPGPKGGYVMIKKAVKRYETPKAA